MNFVFLATSSGQATLSSTWELISASGHWWQLLPMGAPGELLALNPIPHSGRNVRANRFQKMPT